MEEISNTSLKLNYKSKSFEISIPKTYKELIKCFNNRFAINEQYFSYIYIYNEEEIYIDSEEKYKKFLNLLDKNEVNNEIIGKINYKEKIDKLIQENKKLKFENQKLLTKIAQYEKEQKIENEKREKKNDSKNIAKIQKKEIFLSHSKMNQSGIINEELQNLNLSFEKQNKQFNNIKKKYEEECLKLIDTFFNEEILNNLNIKSDNIINPEEKESYYMNKELENEEVQCQICKIKPISFERYICSICPKYNLCKNCEEKNYREGIHKHSFIKIRNKIYDQSIFNDNSIRIIVKESYLIYEGTHNYTVKVNIKNNSKIQLPDNIFLYCDKNSNLYPINKVMKIHPLFPQECQILNIKFENLEQFPSDSYKSTFYAKLDKKIITHFDINFKILKTSDLSPVNEFIKEAMNTLNFDF